MLRSFYTTYKSTQKYLRRLKDLYKIERLSSLDVNNEDSRLKLSLLTEKYKNNITSINLQVINF